MLVLHNSKKLGDILTPVISALPVRERSRSRESQPLGKNPSKLHGLDSEIPLPERFRPRRTVGKNRVNLKENARVVYLELSLLNDYLPAHHLGALDQVGVRNRSKALNR